MADQFDELAARLSFTDIVRLQDTLSKALVRRFEKKLAVVFSDVVGSTPYFARFGDEAGRKLQQRHVDLAQAFAAKHYGRIVDTAGDGAFLCFPTADDAVKAMAGLQQAIAVDNDSREADHRLRVRVGVHFGPALTDGAMVSGDAVNLGARVSGSAVGGEVRLSSAAFAALTEIGLRLQCRRLGPVELKGLGAVELLWFEWRDAQRFPAVIRFGDGSSVPLPRTDVVRFGRLRELDGVPANDVILSIADESQLARISRWHFELHLRAHGYVLRSVSSASTEVDGVAVPRGEECPVKPGSKVTVGGVLTLELGQVMASGEETMLPG